MTRPTRRTRTSAAVAALAMLVVIVLPSCGSTSAVSGNPATAPEPVTTSAADPPPATSAEAASAAQPDQPPVDQSSSDEAAVSTVPAPAPPDTAPPDTAPAQGPADPPSGSAEAAFEMFFRAMADADGATYCMLMPRESVIGSPEDCAKLMTASLSYVSAKARTAYSDVTISRIVERDGASCISMIDMFAANPQLATVFAEVFEGVDEPDLTEQDAWSCLRMEEGHWVMADGMGL